MSRYNNKIHNNQCSKQIMQATLEIGQVNTIKSKCI